jgi:glycosyltransferase involved in cell wall biosynthesis
VKLAVVSYHLPEAEGTAAGRILLATCEGLIAEGHDVTVTSWRLDPPAGDLPSWCTWKELPLASMARRRMRSLWRPRWEAEALGWDPAPGAAVVADDPASFPAVARAANPAVTFHFLTRLDARATGRPHGGDVQHARMERKVARRAARVLAYSPRVVDALGRGTFVPMALRVPAERLPLVDEPVAALLADWSWPPNRWALDRLLAAWPSVRARVPTARLLLAGPGDPSVGTLAGVDVLGRVDRSEEVLSRAAVLAFPCPPSSGPKVKVIEALAAGLPVVTTAAGVEGVITAGDDVAAVATADADGFAAALARVLGDPSLRATLADAGVEAIVSSHAPRPAARARIAALGQA